MSTKPVQSSPVNVTLGNFAENTEQLSFLMDVKEEVCGTGTVGNCIGEEASLRIYLTPGLGEWSWEKNKTKLGLSDVTESLK